MEAVLDFNALACKGWRLPLWTAAKRLLEKGFTPRQVSLRLRLSEEAAQALAEVCETTEEMPAAESWEAARARMAQEHEALVLATAGKILRAVDTEAEVSEGFLSEGTLELYEKAASMSHKYLKSGEEKVKSLTLNFGALAQIEPEMKQVIEMETLPADGTAATEEWLDS